MIAHVLLLLLGAAALQHQPGAAASRAAYFAEEDLVAPRMLVQQSPLGPPTDAGLEEGMNDRPGDIDYAGTGTCSKFGSRILKKVVGINPEQLHITLWDETTVLVSWAVGDALLGPGPSTPSWLPNAVQAVVQYGTSPNSLTKNATGSQNNVVYQRTHRNIAEWGLTYSSPILCHVPVTGLKPGQTYYYRVGDPTYHAWSDVRKFTVPNISGKPADKYPFRLAVVADMATSNYTAINIDNMVAVEPHAVLFTGDLCYADMYQDNGTMQFGEMPAAAAALRDGVSQPGPVNGQSRWDNFGRLIEPLVSRVPLFTVNGNHELEPEEGAEPVLINKAYNARFPMPQTRGSSGPLPTQPNQGGAGQFRFGTTNLWFSTPLPGAYLITLTFYFDFTEGSPQYNWFKEQLASIDRAKYPWLLVAHHVPIYNTLISHYVEGECARKILEPLYIQYGVDMVFTGHAHGYERTFPIADYKLSKCGYIHVQTGAGGQDAKQDFVDGPKRPAYCENATQFYVNGETWYPAYKLPNGDPSKDSCRIPPAPQPTCPKSQPAWSAYRTPSYGFGLFTVLSDTTATWEYVLAEPQMVKGKLTKVVDKINITRDSSCISKKGSRKA